MKDLSSSEINWLHKATTGRHVNFISIQEDFAVASDGFRIHVINAQNLPDRIGGVQMTDVLLKFSEENKIAKFKINPEFLSDALSGFNGKEVDITLFENSQTKTISITVDNDKCCNKKVFVMCMYNVYDRGKK